MVCSRPRLDSQTQKQACAHCGTQLAPGAVACFKCGNAVEVREPTAYTDGIRPPTQVSSSNANLLDNKWLLVEQIGAGGMGTVWSAKDTTLDRKVAVKILSESLASLPEYIERFEREARVMASVDHQNLITLFAVGRRGNQPYMVMKFLDGQPLNKLLNPRLSPTEALPLFRQMCDGLSAMHARNILHRDIKPANLFVSPTGHLTVLDLGIARQVGSTLTKTGIMFGTPAYMSPEQIAGEKALDRRVDIYAAGAVLYEMLTGHTPFEADEEHSLLLAHIQQPPPDASQLFPDIPRGLAIAIQRALSKRPADRFSEITELYDAVAASLGQAPLKPQFAPRADAPAGPTRPLVPKPDEDDDELKTTPAMQQQLDTEPGRPALAVDPDITPKGRPSSPALQKPRTPSNPAFPKTGGKSGSNPVYAKTGGPSGSNPAYRKSSKPEVAAVPPPPAAPDAPTPKGAPAPVDLQATRARKAISGLPPMHLGPRILIGAGVTAFVLMCGYFMLKVIAETPVDEKPVVVSGKTLVLKTAEDTPPPPKQMLEASPPLADSLKTVDGTTVDLAKLNAVGAQASVIKTEEELAKLNAKEEKTRGAPAASSLRRAGSGELRITTTYAGKPVSAIVYVGRKLVGKTPLFMRARTGIYKLKVVYGDLKPVKLDYIVSSAKGQELEMELGPLPTDVKMLAEEDRKANKERASTDDYARAAEREPDPQPESGE